ncbi:hypothetical protein HUJ05_000346 [Dendroctonus ponderosae]|nr:hypothetical protein HUJ05_000346 [Dendroctonus ponderosae]
MNTTGLRPVSAPLLLVLRVHIQRSIRRDLGRNQDQLNHDKYISYADDTVLIANNDKISKILSNSSCSFQSCNHHSDREASEADDQTAVNAGGVSLQSTACCSQIIRLKIKRLTSGTQSCGLSKLVETGYLQVGCRLEARQGPPFAPPRSPVLLHRLRLALLQYPLLVHLQFLPPVAALRCLEVPSLRIPPFHCPLLPIRVKIKIVTCQTVDQLGRFVNAVPCDQQQADDCQKGDQSKFEETRCAGHRAQTAVPVSSVKSREEPVKDFIQLNCDIPGNERNMYEPVVTRCITPTSNVQRACNYSNLIQIGNFQPMDLANCNEGTGNNNNKEAVPPLKPPRLFQTRRSLRNSFSTATCGTALCNDYNNQVLLISSGTVLSRVALPHLELLVLSSFRSPVHHLPKGF